MISDYTDQNLFKDQNIVSKYEEFTVEGLKNVQEQFDRLFKWVNEKILYPQLISKKDSPAPLLTLIDLGIGSGKFTIPHIQALLQLISKKDSPAPFSSEIQIQVLGFDNSEHMLNKFAENAENLLDVSLKKKGCDYFFSSSEDNKLIKKIELYKKDLNDCDEIAEIIKEFKERSEATVITFAQVWHYIKDSGEFFEKVIKHLENTYILHYEPIYYFKLLDGNFDQADTSIDFSPEDEETRKRHRIHRSFWCYYFFLRDKIRHYSTQKIKGVKIDECFKLYEENNFTKIDKCKIQWKKNLKFDNLIELIMNPIFSGQYVGLDDDKRKKIAKKIKDEFKDKIECFSGKVDFGYIGHLFSTIKTNKEEPLLIKIPPQENEHMKVANSEAVLLSLKQKFPECRFIGITLVLIDRFRSLEGFKTIEFTNLELWKEYINELKSTGTPSVAEVVIREEIKELRIIDIMKKQNLKSEPKNLNEKAETKIKHSVNILKDKALTQFRLIEEEEKIDLFCFPLFETERIERTFINIVPTFIMEEIDDKKLNEIKKIIQKEWQNIPLIKDKFSEIRKKFKETATRSAIAAIMSRNMSHNIGSHVLARISGDECIDNKVWARDIKILAQYLLQRQDFIAQIATDWPEWTYPAWLMKDLMRWFLSQKHLLNYIGRSEDLEAHFYNETEQENPDIRFHVFRLSKGIWYKRIWSETISRHKCKDGIEVWKDVIENACHKGDVKTSANPKYTLLYTGKDTLSCYLDDDIQVAIPGGITGYHAFYTIIENVIRNGAKHSFTRMKRLKEDYDSGVFNKREKKASLEEKLIIAFGEKMNDFHMDVIIEYLEEEDRDNYRFRIYDNVSFVAGEDIPIEYCEYYFSFQNMQENDTRGGMNPFVQGDYDKLQDLKTRVDKETPNIITELFKKIYNMDIRRDAFNPYPEKTISILFNHLAVCMNNYLRQDIITETGELKKGEWGLAEMKISSGYLLQKEITEIGSGKDNITSDSPNESGRKTDTGDRKDLGFIIRATVSPLGTLAYEFRIPKPKKVGIVCNVKS